MVQEEYGYPPQGGEKVQYQSVPVSPNELYANAMQEDKVRNIISQLDPDNQLQEIEMRIKGYKKNVFSGNWEKIDKDLPEPPKQLISRFVSYLGGIMNQNTTQGNLSENQVNKIMKNVIEYVIDELDTHIEDYGFERMSVIEKEIVVPIRKVVKKKDGSTETFSYRDVRKVKVITGRGVDYTEMTRIGDIIMNSVFFVLTRALEGQEAKRMWKSLSLAGDVGDNQQKNKIAEDLKFWK